MRLSTRLLSNAATTYLRLGSTFVLGLFTTWYVLGAIGVLGFGLIALAVSSTGVTHALELALRFGLVRELAAAISSAKPATLRRSVTAAFRLCRQATLPLAAVVLVLAAAAWNGLFNTPQDRPELKLALAVLILGEGIHAAARLMSAPFLQSLFAAQHVWLDNLLMVVARASHALSAVIVFGWILPDRSLEVQLVGFALSRATIQLVDVALGVWLAKRLLPDLVLEATFDETEYRAVRSTVWHSSQVEMLLNLNPQFLAILINLFFGLTYNGIWQIVVQFSGYARMFAEGLLRGLAPLVTHLEETGRKQAVMNLMARSVRYQFAIALPAAILLGLYVRPLLELWVGRRLAGDPHLAAAGVSVDEALGLAAAMVVIMLVIRTLRAGFYGIESVLYGMGKVRSYAWFSKWSTVLTLGAGAALMAWSHQPLAAPVALLIASVPFSPGVILLAARDQVGLHVTATLRRSLPRPLLANAVFLALLALARPCGEGLTLVGFGTLLIASTLLYAALALLVVFEADERQRLAQIGRRALGAIRSRLLPRRPR